jgi:tRNA A-37 threonylcarbamoyl transferase component Bud32
MAFVDINPRYRPLLARQGLVTVADFLSLEGVLIGGHADRHAARVILGGGPGAIEAYLKREQCVRWRDRLASAWAGFGRRSRSCREAAVLRQLGPAGIDCPEVIAAGEDGGRAFLLTRALPETVDLRHFLHETGTADPGRGVLAARLGRALAALHAAGFTHPDLYSKHVLVSGEPGAGSVTLAFVDWQRARRCRCLGWARRARDLAALDATLADDLVTPRERLTCLAAYHRCLAGPGVRGRELARFREAVRRQSLRLLRRRRIREMRQPPLGAEAQQLCPLGGDAVRVTRQFREELRGRIPEWLRFPHRYAGPTNSVGRQAVVVAPTRVATLVCRRTSRPLRWLWGRLWGRPVVSVEVERAGTLFRLERYGVRTPRLLAFGQRSAPPWRTESVLVTEAPPATIPLGRWLRKRIGRSAGALRQQRGLVREAGDVMRRLHEAACYLGPEPYQTAAALLVQTLAGGAPQLLVAGVETIRRCHGPSARLALRDIAALRTALGSLCSRTDALRFWLAYLNVPRVTPDARRLAWRVLGVGRRLGHRCRAAVRRARL